MTKNRAMSKVFSPVTAVANAADMTAPHPAYAPAAEKRIVGDWGWSGEYDPAVFAPLTAQTLQDEGWPV